MTHPLRKWPMRVLACVALATMTPLAARADDAGTPVWLRAPFARGPVAATAAVDDRHLWWGIDGMLPLSIGSPREPAAGLRTPALALGLSVAGRDLGGARDLRYTALLDRTTRGAGGWLGVSTGGRDSPNARLHIGTGLWRSFKPIQVEAGVVSSIVAMVDHQADHWGYAPDSLHWRDTTTFHDVDHSTLRTLAQTTMRWQAGRVELAASCGFALGSPGGPRRWAQATLNVQASRRMLVMLAVGQRPGPALAFDASARPHTMVGVQLAPRAAREWAMASAVVPSLRAWTTRPLPDGQTALRVRCPDAARVEIAGDFTDWAPIALEPMGSGWWDVDLEIGPGLHQVQVRVDDGPWQVPPGLPVTQGDFAGAAGVLLIE